MSSEFARDRAGGHNTRPQCEWCHRSVSRAYARTFGANDGTVYACYRCETKTAIRNGAAANPEFTRRVEKG